MITLISPAPSGVTLISSSPEPVSVTRAPSPAEGYVASLESAHSRRSAIWALRAMARAIGQPPEVWASIPWHQLDPAVLAAAQTRLASTLAPASVNLARAMVQGVLRFAWRQGQLDEGTLRRMQDSRPARGSRLPQGRALNAREQQILLAEAARAPGLLGLRNVALVALGIGCGLRRSELCGLDVGAFDPEAFEGRGGVRLVGKGNKEALQPLPPSVRDALQRWVDARGGAPGPLFPRCSSGGEGWVAEPLRPARLYKLLAALGERAGLGALHPHDLRRTYATSLFRAGHDQGTVQRLMRHASPATTARYDLRGQDELAAAAATLAVPVP